MKSRYTLILMVALLLQGCSVFKMFKEMSPRAKAHWMMSVFNGEIRDYELQAARPGLTEDQKQVLRWKKKLLMKVYPLINRFVLAAERGETPSEVLESEIVGVLNKLVVPGG